MSFLTNLLSKKANLRPTTTTVTQLDGRRFCSNSSTNLNNDNCQEIEQKQFGFVVDTKPDNVPARVLEGLYLGSQDCCEASVLKNFNIGCVLSVGIEAPTKYENIVYKFVQCFDLPETNLIENQLIDECVDFIKFAITELKQNVLVHCNAGVSRSASIVIGYLILVHNYNFVDAYQIVKSVRSCIRPNDGFVHQLKQLDKTFNNNINNN